MVNLFKALLLLLLMLGSNTFASPTASIDRSVIAEDDTLTLKIRVDRSSFSGRPDLQPLDKDFDVLGNSQSSQHIIRNGRSDSFTEWTITLYPKRKGELRIPAIEVGGEKTRPLSVRVMPAVPRSAGNLAPVFLETEVDKNSVYVQQQVIFTVRIFQSIQLDDMNISEPELEQALVEKLSQTSFQRRVQNTPYRVHELKYAIFPQQSGELTIPELSFTAREATARRSVFDLPGQGRPIRKQSKPLTISVDAPPPGFSGSIWLPASDLKLTETWSDDPTAMKVGDSITRTINLNTEGLVGSQLPEITITASGGAKLYPDQGNSETNVTAEGARAVRQDSTAIIPTRAGTLTLPEIRLQWWDTRADQLREAVIAEQRFTIARNANAPIENISPQPAIATPPSEKIDAGETVIEHSAGFWPWLTALFFLAWLITLYFYWQLRQQPGHLDTQKTNQPLPSAAYAFKTLNDACHANAATEVRSALIIWAQCCWPDKNIQSLQDVHHQVSGNLPLGNALMELDTYLYSGAQSSWNGENLLALIKALRKNKTKPENDKQSLQSLYPA